MIRAVTNMCVKKKIDDFLLTFAEAMAIHALW